MSLGVLLFLFCYAVKAVCIAVILWLRVVVHLHTDQVQRHGKEFPIVDIKKGHKCDTKRVNLQQQKGTLTLPAGGGFAISNRMVLVSRSLILKRIKSML